MSTMTKFSIVTKFSTVTVKLKNECKQPDGSYMFHYKNKKTCVLNNKVEFYLQSPFEIELLFEIVPLLLRPTNPPV